MAIMEISVGVPKKLKIELLYHTAIPLLGMYSKDVCPITELLIYPCTLPL